MRRPLPPELVLLGDQLEVGARRALGYRRTRRQMILNAITSVAIAVPLLASALGTFAPAGAPQTVITPNPTAYGHKGFDAPPRLLRRVGHPNDDVLYEATTLRRALR
jgi:hypothetical protein